jgi:nucleotide-binding universal stress UspA family protein
MYKKILVPVDGSKLAECVLPQVKTLVADNKDAEVVIFHVWEPQVEMSMVPPELRSRYEKAPVVPGDTQLKWKAPTPEDLTPQARKFTQEQMASYLDDIKREFQEAGIKTFVEVAVGTPAIQIVDYANKNQADVIVMATHGRSGIARWALGSVADKVLRTSPVPVISVRPKECQMPQAA